MIIPGDKDSSIRIIDKNYYVKKIQQMINNEIQDGVYAKTEDTTLLDLKHFQDYPYRNFSKYENIMICYQFQTNLRNFMEQQKLTCLMM